MKYQFQVTFVSPSFTWEKEIAKEQHGLLQAVCNTNYKAMVNIIWSSEEGKTSMIDIVGKAIDKEAMDICSNKPTSFRIDDMEDFVLSFKDLSAELTERAKILTKCLTSASHNERNLRRNKLKTIESLTPNLVYAAGLLFQSRNQRVNAI